MYYAGIGSRKIPKVIKDLMVVIGYAMAENGYVLRSGGAEGADTAFQKGCQQWCDDNNVPYCKRQEIYLPWNNFNNLKVDKHKGITTETFWLAHDLVYETHPNAKNLSPSVMKLMVRNVAQIYGLNNTPSDLIICWTPDGATKTTTNETGGTGQALRLALIDNIPIINLKLKKHIKLIEKILI
jgi:hypothetical protein